MSMIVRNKQMFMTGLAVVMLITALCVEDTNGYAGSLKDAIAKTPKGTAMNQIDSSAEPGFLGISGAPSPNLIVAYLWAIWVGWIFSTVGAFGGIMAGVGHITILGFGDYAKGFGKGAPLNKLVTDSIRVSNQWLVGLSAIISGANYYRMGRLVAPLGMCLAIGSVGGSWLIPDLTAGKINLKDYIGYFGLIVLLLGMMLLKETTATGQAKKIKAKEAATAFEMQTNREDISYRGVNVIQGSWPLMFTALGLVVASALWINLIDQFKWMAYFLSFAGWTVTFLMGEIKFSFYGVEFNFKAFIPMLGGIFIAAIASFLGIGGGFLCVPFLTSVAGLPMFLVAGTSALVVFVGMAVSIFSYMIGKGVPIAWELIGAELIGIFLGSMIGPHTSKFIPDIWLKRIFIVLAFYVGLRYVTKGFLGLSIFPPF